MFARIRAMLLRCRKNGGDCPCGTECRAESEQSRRNAFAVTVPVPKVAPEPAIVRPDWRRPFPKARCRLVAHNTGDGWWFGWERDDGETFDIVGEEAWPFVDDWATASDWRRLGIEVV